MRQVLNDDRVTVRLCYCSPYNDCWVSDSRAAEPAPVDACPADAAPEFRS
jgi:hypothetical protein